MHLERRRRPSAERGEVRPVDQEVAGGIVGDEHVERDRRGGRVELQHEVTAAVGGQVEARERFTGEGQTPVYDEREGDPRDSVLGPGTGP